MVRFQMQFPTEHPVLFLADDAGEFAVPEDVGMSFVAASRDCLCFSVLAYVDGASVVTVSDERPDTPLTMMFSGAVESRLGVLSVSDSNGFSYLRIPVTQGNVAAEIWSDDPLNPGSVWIVLTGIQSY
jgi:hypothetical protein